MGELEGTEAAFNEEETPAVEEVPGEAEVETDGAGERLDDGGDEVEKEVPAEEEIEQELEKEIEQGLKSGHADFATIKKEFPELFKKHPELRDVIFKEREFTKTCGSVSEAKDAMEKAEIFDFIDRSLNNGDPNPLVKALNDGALEKFAGTILPTLADRNPELLVKATKPLLMNVLRSMEREGVNAGQDSADGKNLIAAAKIFKKFLYGGDYNIPKAEEQQEPDSIKQQRQQLQQQQDQMWTEKMTEFRDTRDSFATSKLTTLISEKLGPTTGLSAKARESIIQGIVDDIGSTLSSDELHMSNMRSLMKRAAKAGFPRNMVGQQIDAYLARARRLVPNAVQAFRQEGGKGKVVTGKVIPQGSSGSGAPNPSKKIDYRATSTEDLFNNKVTYRK